MLGKKGPEDFPLKLQTRLIRLWIVIFKDKQINFERLLKKSLGNTRNVQKGVFRLSIHSNDKMMKAGS